ncbi:hypothetical protein [Butyrivibrio sp. MC2013]|nr:hypothetical protein [Butyrivibrio sp. MC2013]
MDSLADQAYPPDSQGECNAFIPIAQGIGQVKGLCIAEEAGGSAFLYT